jgi:hypothetical protein
MLRVVVLLANTFADEQYDRFNSNAVELVRRKVDVIVAVTRSAVKPRNSLFHCFVDGQSSRQFL